MPSLHFDNIACGYAANNEYKRTVYFLSPVEFDMTDIETISETYKCNFVVLSGFDWNNDLTPWIAPGIRHQDPPFGGNADKFAGILTDTIIPGIENNDGFRSSESRDLAGISLSGLFALWLWTKDNTFHNIASISGSFWYNGFIDYLGKTDLTGKDGMAYFALGVNECRPSFERFRSNATQTAVAVQTLRRNHVRATFEWVPGGHNSPILPRINKAVLAMTTDIDIPTE